MIFVISLRNLLAENKQFRIDFDYVSLDNVVVVVFFVCAEKSSLQLCGIYGKMREKSKRRTSNSPND